MFQIPVRNVFRSLINSHTRYRLISASTSNEKKPKEDAITQDLKLSDGCVERLKLLCNDSNSYLRLSVEGGGCSGFQYKFGLEDKILPDDK